jgi:hypothetical protein
MHGAGDIRRDEEVVPALQGEHVLQALDVLSVEVITM